MVQPMLISLRCGEEHRTFALGGATQSLLWIGLGDYVGAEDALAVVVSSGDGAVLRPVRSSRLMTAEGQELAEYELTDGCDRILCIEGPYAGGRVWVHLRPATEGVRTFRKLGMTHDVDLRIGRASTCALRYANAYVSLQHAELRYRHGSFSVCDLESGNGTLVNGRPLSPLQPMRLKAGDVVQVLDLTLMVGGAFLVCNCPEDLVWANVEGIAPLCTLQPPSAVTGSDESEEGMAFFYPAPRLSRTVSPYELKVDDPPAKKAEDDTPLFLQLGPSAFMGIASVFTAASALSQLAAGGEVMRVLPSVAMAVSMLGGSLAWPLVSKRYQRRRDRRLEERRARRYVDYLDGIENELLDQAALQGSILRENRLPVGELLKQARELSPFMMNRMSSHADFMELRVGMGDVALAAELTWPQPKFSLVEDPLLNKVKDLAQAPPCVTEVPIAFNPVEHRVAGIVGRRSDVWAFLRGLIVQVCSYYSYDDMKVVLVARKAERAEWDFLTSLQHFYDDAGTHRLVALSPDGMVEENLLLMGELEARREMRVAQAAGFGTHYLVICADKLLAERLDVLDAVAGPQANLGISIIYLAECLRELPRECTYIIDLARESERYFSPQGQVAGSGGGQRRLACMFEQSDVTGTMIDFDPDIMVSARQARQFALDIARARLDVAAERSLVPESVGFLEMFRVGNVAHLGIGQRWVDHDASRTLQTPVGIDELGEHATLNLHENIHGPHGLIAGTTGSGKSEFIITYVLSLCVNYAPDEVAFVLIDYKGGGLAGAFDNERYHLPHLAGTITNLDGGSIRRSLVSIQSELKRRQDLFNKARDLTGESTIDIYKYLSYYRQGVLVEPLPHLFIVADEFAELKQQEPEFMDELISAARIGRSLGVHLILATQRPTGVVNDQIWANAKFKLCLKVSDAGDSKEMIRRSDAAEIKQAGRYYLLVGYNESFSGGQAAYAGAPYVERAQYEPKTDNAVDLIDAEGDVITTLRPMGAARANDISELNAVLAQLMLTADSMDKHAQRLWLEPLPPRWTARELQEKYGPVEKHGLTFILGEVDDPMHQRQFRHDVDLAKVGNVMFYGMHMSGVGSLVASCLVDLATRYMASEYCFYGIDLGAGALASLAGLPQCGGVCLAGQDEKVENLLKLLARFIDERKQTLATSKSLEAYNETACARGELGFARVVLALDNLASFRERYDRFFDALVALAMDGPLVGIYCLVTAANSTVAGMKLKQYFPMDVVCALADPAEVTYILTNARQAPVPSNAGRCLISIDKETFECQGITLVQGGQDEAAVISSLALELSGRSAVRAEPIPVLPTHVYPDAMGVELPWHQVPVGYAKRGVAPYFFNTSKFAYLLVVGEDGEVLGSYFDGLKSCLAQWDASYRFVDDAHLMAACDDAHVMRAIEDVETFVASLPPKPLQADYYVFTDLTRTMAGLSEGRARILASLIADERTKNKVVMVVGVEAMRVKGLFDPWFQFLRGTGNGLWIGSGFANQTVFPYGRTLPEYHKPAQSMDGFVVMKGEVTGVKLLEARGSPGAGDSLQGNAEEEGW